jgi:hypothetical protein
MMETPTRVTIVLEPEFHGQLIELARQRDVWVVDTPHNRVMAEKLWQSESRDSYQSLTTFDVDFSVSPEMWLLNVLSTIDEHHGLRSDWAPDVELEVRGIGATPEIRAALQEFGPFTVEDLNCAFIARRIRSV